MEALGAVTGGVWSSPGGMYASGEADFMAQLLGKCTFPSEIEGGSVHDVQSSSWPSHGSSFDLPIPMMSASAMCSSGMPDPYLSSYEMGTDVLLSGSSDHESYCLNHSDPAFVRNSSSVPMEYCLGRFSGERNVESGHSAVKEPIIRETCSQLELQGSQVHGVELPPMGDEAFSSGAFRKRSRRNEDLHKNTRMGISKVARKLDFSSNSEEEANVAHPTGPSSSPCQSEDGSIGGATRSSLSLSGSTPNADNLTLISPTGKTRASRGSATDPQSLYARKRREKINERLRILQSLVPNGTKVDISTMLEEALHYVKFLQLQIQLLSSDELWMYAPIAYNGMDIGLNKNTRGRLL